MSKTPKRTGGRRSRGMQREAAADLPYDVPTDPAAPIDNTQAHDVPQPIFGQPVASVDPTEFTVKHASDSQALQDARCTQRAARAAAAALPRAARPA